MLAHANLGVPWATDALAVVDDCSQNGLRGCQHVAASFSALLNVAPFSCPHTTEMRTVHQSGAARTSRLLLLAEPIIDRRRHCPSAPHRLARHAPRFLMRAAIPADPLHQSAAPITRRPRALQLCPQFRRQVASVIGKVQEDAGVVGAGTCVHLGFELGSLGCSIKSDPDRDPLTLVNRLN